MSFNSKSASIESLEEKKASLLSDISKYGIKLEEITSNVESAEKKSSKIKDLTSEVEVISQKRDSVKLELVSLEKQKVSFESYSQSVILSQKILEELDEKIKDGTVQLESLKNGINVIIKQQSDENSKLQTIESDIKVSLLELAEVNEEISNRKTSAQVDFESKSIEYSSILQSLNDNKSSIEEDIKTSSSELDNIKRDTASAAQELLSVQESIKSFSSEYEEKKSSFEKELNTSTESIKEEQLKLIKREGDVSLKESLLKKNTDNLRTIKKQLEQKLGTSITMDL